jgi:putative hemolysin
VAEEGGVVVGAFWELLTIVGLILLNGFFASAEIAILTARRGRLQQLAEDGDGAAKVALELGRDSDRFLPTVQVGITLVSTFASVFGGARIEKQLAAWIGTTSIRWLAEQNHTIAITAVVAGIAFFSLIFGELVPKRVALQNAETFARLVAYPMRLLQQLTRPAIWMLQTVTWLMLRMLGIKTTSGQGVSVEDIEHLIEAGGESGVLEEHEHRMAMEALRLGDRTVTEILRPRIDIDALDVDTPSDEVVGAMAMSGFSRVPVCEGNIDHIVGFVYIKDVFLQQYMKRPIDLRRIMRPALFVPKTLTISRLLEQFRTQRTQLAIVLDEYGGTQGMVTLEDVLEVLVGDIHDEHRQDVADKLVQRPDGSWLVDAAVPLLELEETLDLTRKADPALRGVATAAGMVLALLKRPPHVGDVIEWADCKVEVVDMDGPRIDRLLVSPNPKPDSTSGTPPTSDAHPS